MLRWLPARFQNLYRRLAEAVPYTRRRPPPPPEADPAPPAPRHRLARLHIAQDAWCRLRPNASRRRQRTEYAPRGVASWCEAPPARPDDPPGHRCAACDRARTLYLAASGGDAAAERRLHRLARRGAIKLLAERRFLRWRRRADRAISGSAEPPLAEPLAEPPGAPRAAREPQPPDLVGGHRVPIAECWHRAIRHEEEQALLRAHARHLRAQIRRRRARLTEAALASPMPARPPAERAAENPAPVPARAPRRLPAEGPATLPVPPAPRPVRVRPITARPTTVRPTTARTGAAPRPPRGPAGARRGAGFTLLEVVIALVIASLALAVMVSGVVGGLRTTSTAAGYEIALSRAQSHLAAAAAAPVPGETSGDDGGGYKWRLHVARADGTRLAALEGPAAALGPLSGQKGLVVTLYDVVVTESWGPAGAKPREIRLATQRLAMAPGT